MLVPERMTFGADPARIMNRAGSALPEVSNFGDLGALIIPESLDKYLGNSSEAEAVKESGGLLGNKAATDYVNGIGQKLVSKSDRPSFGYKFDIVTDQRPNAFALPNGSVYITLGLLRLMRNNAQLANVLAHEVSHVTKRHSVKQLETNLGAIGVLNLASLLAQKAIGKDQAKEAKDFVFGLISNGYSREHEHEADKVGHALAASAGYSPQGMIDVMTILGSLEKEKPEGLEAYFRSHPYATERGGLALKRLPNLPQGEIGQDAYQNFLTRILGIGSAEAKTSPVKTGTSFIPSLPPSLQKAMQVQSTAGSWLIPGLLIGGGALAVLAAAFYLRRQ